MSIPRSMTLPASARAVSLDSPYGAVAGLGADPPADRDGPARAPVLLLPGFTGSKEDFLALLEPLAGAGHPVIAVDQRGQFESVGPEGDEPEAYSLDRFAEEACVIAAALGGDVHVVGHSFGGLVARAMTLRDPKLVRSLTLLCSGPGPVPADQHGDLDTFVMGLPFVGKDAAWSIMRERSAATRGDATPEVEEFVRNRFVASSVGSLIGIARILRETPDRTDELAALDLPIQVVCGADDDAWPVDLQAATAERLGAPFHTIAGAGHSPNVDEPVATAAVLAAFFSESETR